VLTLLTFVSRCSTEPKYFYSYDKLDFDLHRMPVSEPFQLVSPAPKLGWFITNKSRFRNNIQYQVRVDSLKIYDGNIVMKGVFVSNSADSYDCMVVYNEFSHRSKIQRFNKYKNDIKDTVRFKSTIETFAFYLKDSENRKGPAIKQFLSQ
jgi:hypothetical protein